LGSSYVRRIPLRYSPVFYSIPLEGFVVAREAWTLGGAQVALRGLELTPKA
jgi:hypothetical protein